VRAAEAGQLQRCCARSEERRFSRLRRAAGAGVCVRERVCGTCALATPAAHAAATRSQAPPARWREQARGRVREYALAPDGCLSEREPSSSSSALPSDADGGDARSDGVSRRLADAARDFLLPPGYPGSVSDDYLRYAALSFPCHVTGALQGGLATAALLHGVGLGAAVAAAPGAPAALSAAVKWVSKDGLGAAGRLVVAGRVAGYLDAEPRQWRLYAEAAATLGGALDVATSLAPPAAFLPLAAAGTALRACGKAVAAPAHQVILQHFARASNLGAVAAKEEVQEVLAQLTGLALSVALLQQPALKGEDASVLAAAWAAVTVAHVALRWATLAGLRFRTLNARRAAEAAVAHVGGEAPGAWAGREALNAREAAAGVPLVGAPRLRVRVGVSLQEALRKAPAGSSAAVPPLNALAFALRRERFLLTWRTAGSDADGASARAAAWVVLREGATPRDALRAVWLAARLCAPGGAGCSLDAALAELAMRFPSFEEALSEEGWELHTLLPPPATTPRLLDDADDVADAQGSAREADAAVL
jgi:hypothetical protein